MTKTLQEAFLQLQEAKRKAAALRKQKKETLLADRTWADLQSKGDETRDRRKARELQILTDTGLAQPLEAATASVRQARELLSNVALTAAMRGENLVVKDGDDGQKFAVQFSVRMVQMEMGI